MILPLLVSFSELGDDDRVLALTDVAPAVPEMGQRVYLLDADGNSCFGTVAHVVGGLIEVDADWNTWMRAEDAEAKVYILCIRAEGPEPHAIRPNKIAA